MRKTCWPVGTHTTEYQGTTWAAILCFSSWTTASSAPTPLPTSTNFWATARSLTFFRLSNQLAPFVICRWGPYPSTLRYMC
ncbi:hypothetical protein F5141DRAFT_102940 [Pisolithus sp. B1]|nr:hypothetical protein F5141DRAFT_102940 [Pisolithus sp. B1]